MQIWEMEAYPVGDRRLPHHVFPPKIIPITELSNFTDLHLYKVDLDDTMAMKKRLSRVKTEWGVSVTDVMTLDEKITDLNAKLDDLYEPVEASEDTVCLVLDGEIYYDVEYDDEKWLRLLLQKGDLLVLPKGAYYRSTVTPRGYVRLQRFSKERQIESG